MKPLRIAISNPRSRWGGVSSMALTLAAGLRERGHHVVIVCRPRSALFERAHAQFPVEPVLYGRSFPLGLLLRTARALRRHRVQVLISAPPMDLGRTALAARSIGVPVLMRIVDNIRFDEGWPRRWLARIPDLYVANSDATREDVLALHPWLDRALVSTVHNGIDVARVAATPPAAVPRVDSGLVFGFVGRMEERKGLGEIAAAWPGIAAALPAATLVLAGTGDWEGHARARLAGAPRVHFLGYRTDVHALMVAIDVLLAPSWREPFGIVAVEAMAAGTPVIASAAGGMTEVVQDGVTGVLVPPRDADALARAAIELGRSPEVRAAMGERARARASSHFSRARLIDDYEALLERIVRGRAA